MTVNTTSSSIQQLLQKQRTFFKSGKTKSVNFRLEQLRNLRRSIIDNQDAILEAIRADLGRPTFEAYLKIMTLNEVNAAIRSLKKWVKPRRIITPIEQFSSTAWIQPEPLGIALIIAPWNYPFQLIISPLIGAIAAGNCAVLKPSENAPHTSSVVAKMISASFPPEYIAVVEGDVELSKRLLDEKLDEKFDHISG